MCKAAVLAVMVFALTIAGCGSDSDDSATAASIARPNENGEVLIDMAEFTFGVDLVEVTAGQTVTFVILNDGAIGHEFMVGRDVQTTSEGTASGFALDFFDGTEPLIDPPSAGMFMGATGMGTDEHTEDPMAGMDMGTDEHTDSAAPEEVHGDEHAGFMVERMPGEVARITVQVPADAAGEWEIGCFEGGGSHWDAGMRASMIVLEA